MTAPMDTERFPLSWPTGWPRTPRGQRQRARFQRTEARAVNGTITRSTRALTVADALSRLQGEVDRLGAVRVLVSSNVELRLDGLPRSGQAEPADAGAAVYFTLKGQPRCLACDRWDRVADNLAAIAQHIDALRRIDRYGVGTMEQAFAGYKALPAQASPWWTVLEFEARPTAWAAVEERYTALARRHHPDRGGDAESMAKINAARDAARLDLGAAA
jgi:hypothetical protein